MFSWIKQASSILCSTDVLLDQAQHFVCGVGGETCGVATVTAIAAGVPIIKLVMCDCKQSLFVS